VNDYKCHCPDGYYEDENEAENLIHDCIPVKCGKPPSEKHSTTDKADTVIFFNMDPVKYECDLGYTVDAAPEGVNFFEVKCLHDTSFAAALGCKAVACGKAPVVDNAEFPTDKEFFFQDTVAYTCKEGYSHDHTLAGKTAFTGKCDADGEIKNVLACLPIRCPSVPAQKFVQVNHGGETLVFAEKLESNCLPGYALNKDKHDKTTYDIKCLATAKNEITGACTAIDCGDLPEVDNAEVKGSDLFGGTVKVTCNKGYSIDETPVETSSKYEIGCLASGKFADTQECKKVKCGVPPEVHSTKRDVLTHSLRTQSNTPWMMVTH
jgi:hypothetical protein